MNELERVEAQALREITTLAGGRAELVGGAQCVSCPEIPSPSLNLALPLGAHGYTPGCAWMKFERGDEPAPAVYRNIMRAGFREAYLRRNWQSPA